jgi:uncharacterized protein YmfQ (DUF2313 family)
MANYDKILRLKGKNFDSVQASAQEIVVESFPDTARSSGESSYGMLEWWERMFDITPPIGATYAERRMAVVAAERATGGVTDAYFRRLAEALGYTIGTTPDPHMRFTEGDFPRAMADFAEADISQVWDQDSGASAVTWCVLGTDVESDTVLQALFNRSKVKGTEIIFINE